MNLPMMEAGGVQPEIVQPGCVVEMRVPVCVYRKLAEEDRRFMVGSDHYIVVPDAEMSCA